MTVKRSGTSVFSFEDYKDFLRRQLVGEPGSMRGLRSALSKSMGCQLSYLSQVLNGDAQLNLEQAEAAARYFVLNEIETSYFLILVCEARAGTPTLKSYWKSELKKVQKEYANLRHRLPLEQPLNEEQKSVYYSDWHYAAIHVLASIPQLQTPDAMAAALKISPTKVRKALQFLCSIRLLERKGGKYQTTKTQMHLAKDSPLVSQHHLNWKIRTIESLSSGKESDLHYTSVMSISKQDFLKVKNMILDTLASTHNVIKDSKDEIAATFTIDLFELGASQ